MTIENRSDRRLQSGLASLDEIKGTGADCPMAERIWDSATGLLSASDDKIVVSHLGECGSCSSAWRIARELVRDEAPVISAAPSTGSAWRTWVPLVAAASVVVAAVSVAVVWFREPAGEPPVYRTQPGDRLAAGTPPDAPPHPASISTGSAPRARSGLEN